MKLKEFNSVFKNILSVFRCLLILVFLLFYLFMLVWTYCYNLYVSYVLITGFISFVSILIFNRNWRTAINFLLFASCIFFLSIPFNLKQYNKNGEEFQRRVNDHRDLSTREKLGVYGCLVMITVFDAIPFPEAAKENFFLFFPEKNKKRIFHSNSILNSPSIMNAIMLKKEGKLSWNKWNYVFSKDFRYIIAFDPCIIRLQERDKFTEVMLLTSFGYRKNYPTLHATTFLRGWFAFRVEEGLFWYLQEKKWLHPYAAIWLAKMDRHQ